jgi:hypothetical protein
MTSTGQPWSNVHELQVFNQVEQRPTDSRWVETQATGQVLVLCNCGYVTGWIPRDQMPDRAELVAAHGVPFASLMA